MIQSDRELLTRAIAHYGEKNQILKALEEMTELSHELWCARKGDCVKSAIREEIADVRIMLDQLELMFGDTSVQRENKLRRLAKRMGG